MWIFLSLLTRPSLTILSARHPTHLVYQGTAHFEEWDFFDNSISVEDLDYEEDPTDYEGVI